MATTPTLSRRSRSTTPSGVIRAGRRLYRPASPPANASRNSAPSPIPWMRPHHSRYEKLIHLSSSGMCEAAAGLSSSSVDRPAPDGTVGLHARCCGRTSGHACEACPPERGTDQGRPAHRADGRLWYGHTPPAAACAELPGPAGGGPARRARHGPGRASPAPGLPRGRPRAIRGGVPASRRKVAGPATRSRSAARSTRWRAGGRGSLSESELLGAVAAQPAGELLVGVSRLDLRHVKLQAALHGLTGPTSGFGCHGPPPGPSSLYRKGSPQLRAAGAPDTVRPAS